MTVKLDIFYIVRILIWWNTWKYNNRCSFGNSLAFPALHLPQHAISSGLVSPKKQQDSKPNQKESFTFTFTESLIFFPQSWFGGTWQDIWKVPTIEHTSICHTRPWLWEEGANLPCSSHLICFVAWSLRVCKNNHVETKKARTWHGMPCCGPATNTKITIKHTETLGDQRLILQSYLYRYLVSTFCRNWYLK